MAHAFKAHRVNVASSRRVRHIIGKASGGSCGGSDQSPLSSAGNEGKKRGTSAMRPEMKAEGKSSPKRFAKGGKVKHTTNVVIMGHPPAPAMAAPPPGAPPMMPPGAPAMKRGGRLPKAGAADGVGRLEKSRMY
jgi:hypothetical protein